jgi:tripartite-type tricarboxylate transporter receptor subunit TctC
MIAGRVDFYVSPTLAVVPQYESKQLRVLAVSAPERLQRLPQVPTLKEAGIDYVRFGWLGICAAEGTPQPIIDRLNREVVSIVATPEYRAMIENAGSIAVSSTPGQLGQVIKQTLDDVAATIQEFGLQQER